MTRRRNDLERALRALGEHGERIAAFDPGPEDLDEIRDDLAKAHRALTRARAVVGDSGCQVHPGGPVDTEAGGGCLLCATNRRRGQIPGQPAADNVPTSEICRAIVEQGHQAAVAAYGARAVTRAIVTCRNDPEFLEESA